MALTNLLLYCYGNGVDPLHRRHQKNVHVDVTGEVEVHSGGYTSIC